MGKESWNRYIDDMTDTKAALCEEGVGFRKFRGQVEDSMVGGMERLQLIGYNQTFLFSFSRFAFRNQGSFALTVFMTSGGIPWCCV